MCHCSLVTCRDMFLASHETWMTQTNILVKQKRGQTQKMQKKNWRSSVTKSLVLQPLGLQPVAHIAPQRVCNIVMIPRTIRPQKSTSPAAHHQKARRNSCSQGCTTHDPGWLKRLWTQDSSLCWRDEREHSQCTKPSVYKWVLELWFREELMKGISVLFILRPDETITRIVKKLLCICVEIQVDQYCVSSMSPSLISHNWLLLLERFYFAAV